MAEKTQTPSKSKAARSEKASKGKTLTWRGVKLKLPPPEKMSGTLLFDLHEMEAQENLGALIGLIGSLVGEEQLHRIRQQVGAEGLSVDETLEALTGLIGDIFEKYGMAPGESAASQGS